MFDVRMALRDPADRQVVAMLTSAAEWPLVETNEHEESAAYMVFRTWAPSSGLWLSYLEDVTTQATVLIAFGDDEDHVADLTRRVSAFVDVVPRTELVAEPVSGRGPAEENSVGRPPGTRGARGVRRRAVRGPDRGGPRRRP